MYRCREGSGLTSDPERQNRVQLGGPGTLVTPLLILITLWTDTLKDPPPRGGRAALVLQISSFSVSVLALTIFMTRRLQLFVCICAVCMHDICFPQLPDIYTIVKHVILSILP
jgi:hypothetical protein